MNRKFKENYIIIPREIIEFNSLSSIRILVYIYLIRNQSLNNTVKMSLYDIILECGYKPDSRKNTINDQFKIVLDNYESIGVFKKMSGDCIGNKLCVLKINGDFTDIPKSYAIVTYSEVDKLLEHKNKHSTVAIDKILVLLTYIRVNSLRRAENQKSSPKNKPEFFFKQIKTISEDLNIDARTISNYIKILEQLDIIVSKPMDRYKDCYDNWHTDVTLFVDKYDGWEQELEWGEKLLKSGKPIKYKQNTS